MSSTQARTLWLAGLSVLFLLALLPFSSYIVAVPYVQSEWQVSNASSGIVFSSYLLGYAASSLVLVPLTDRYRVTNVLILGLIVMSGGHLLFPLAANGVASASLLRALAGAGHVAAYQSAIRLVTERFPAHNRGSAVGLFVAAGFGGTTLSYTVTGQLLALTGSWRSAYLFTALIGPIGLLAFYYAVLHRPASARFQTGTSRGSSADAKRGALDITVLQNRAVLLTTLVYALHTAELYLARLWLPLLLTSSFMWLGQSTEAASVQSATISGPMFMLGVIGVFAGGFISDRIGRIRGTMIIFLCSGLCSFLIGWLVHAPSLLILSGFIYGLTTAADSAVLSAAIIEVAPADRIGSAQAVQSFIGFVIGAAVPVMAGLILDFATQDWRWIIAFSFNGVLALLGIVVLARLAHTRVAKVTQAV